MEDIVLATTVLLIVAGAAAIAIVLIVKNLLYVCEPSKVLIFSGRTARVGKRTVGYRTIKGGRAYRVPFLESVDTMDLTNMIIEVTIANAYSKGGIPLTVQGVANVKIAGHQPLLGNAMERFLDKDRREVARIAKETLEGNLRGVLSQLTPEQVNEDKLAFAEKLLEEAEQDLSKLGLVLDTLKIQNVYDDVGYLNSIGRKTSADLIKRSKVAEANAKAQSVIQEAGNRQRARITELQAELEIIKAETEKRIADIITRRDALIAEEVGQVRAALAKAIAELKAQEARVEQMKRQLKADVVEPAQAAMEAARAKAQGDAQKIIEDGKATAQVLGEMIASWKLGGDNARDIFLMQKLDQVLTSLVGTIHDIQVDRFTMLPAGGQSKTKETVQWVEELKGALGVDLPAAITRFTDGPATTPARTKAGTPHKR